MCSDIDRTLEPSALATNNERSSPPHPDDASLPTVSLIVPAYNEALHMESTLGRILEHMRLTRGLIEVVVVDDGSTDATAGIVKSKIPTYDAAQMPLRLLHLETNQGKGAAIRHGVLSAKGDIVAFIDADLSSPIEALPELVGPIQRDACDVAIASRAVDRSLIQVRQSRFREVAGILFNALVRLITGLPIKDTQCGFKAFRREEILPIFGAQRIGAFAFDVEVLYLARRKGLRILEIPMAWSHVEDSRVRMFRDSLWMFRDVLLIRWHDIFGRYHRALKRKTVSSDAEGRRKP